MSIYEEIDLQGCPKCGGAGLLEEENGRAWFVTCMDCGAHTADVDFSTPEESRTAAKAVSELWNYGKVVSLDPGE